MGVNFAVHPLKWRQLKPAPKPLAVFAASGEQAHDVLEFCESAGLPGPEQIAIVGAETNVGRTPGQEIQRVRIERAKRLLTESGGGSPRHDVRLPERQQLLRRVQAGDQHVPQTIS